MPAPTEPLILAIDLGTSGVKVALITMRGRVLGWESQPVALYLTPDGGAEQSPQEWWQALVSAAPRLLARVPQAAGRVRAVCCSTQGEGTIPVDRAGAPLMNAIEAYIQFEPNLITDGGEVTDLSTEKFLRDFMEEFRTFIERVYTVLPRGN